MKKALFAVIAVVICIFAYGLFSLVREPVAVPAKKSDFSIGMNLSSLSYWTRELPFVDVARSSMPWVTQNDHDIPGGKNPWHTDMLKHMPLDPDGYPLSLPAEVPGAEAPQIVATLMCRSVEGHYPEGRYVCLYDGQGTIKFGFDAKPVSSSPGRIEFDVTPSPAGIFMKIVRSEKGDHIRNIRVIMQGFESTYSSLVFHPVFLERLKPFKVIRFMDWQRTNDSVVQSWAERTRPAAYTQTDSGGVALEYMIELCNRLDADPWFCIPHQADQDYVRRFARLVRDTLEPGRKAYIEYSNEVWNAQFGQYRWVDEHGDQSLSHARKYASFAKQAFDIWQGEFGSRKDRIVRVVSGQQVRPGLIEDIIDHLGATGMDAVASSGYFGIDREGYKALHALGPRATAHDVMRNVYENMRNQALPDMERHARIAARYGLSYVIYEAGQSICPAPLGVSPSYQQALWDAQKSPELYSTYREFMSACRSMNISLFMAYSFVSAQDTRFGSWGHLEHVDQEIAEAPKYRALLDEIRFPYPGEESPLKNGSAGD